MPKDSLDELVTVSVRMPRALSHVLDIQGELHNRSKTDIILAACAVLLSSPLLLWCAAVFDRETLRESARLMQAVLAMKAAEGSPTPLATPLITPENRII